VLIIGGGLAGLYAAMCLPAKMRIAVATKEPVNISSSFLAQGGIAAALDREDRPEFHREDTLMAGAGLCDEFAVRVLVDEGPRDIARLHAEGVPFDLGADGRVALTREGGHTRHRVVHAGGDATGRETVVTLASVVGRQKNVSFMPRLFLVDLMQDNRGRVCGAVLQSAEGQLVSIEAGAVVLCTGGIGQVYQRTTNPSVATGDGIAAAFRAGAALKHMEFVQFHPTALYESPPAERAFLISEAVRGEGGLLRAKDGTRFMVGRHAMAELAPRDIVARAAAEQMRRDASDHVYLDMTDRSREVILGRFPTIYQKCVEIGLEPSQDWIPVCPAQHFMMGGIATDLWARTALPGLYACGEVSCNGVHGANRLACNSLLECLVFSRRAAEDIAARMDSPAKPEPCQADNGVMRGNTVDDGKVMHEIRRDMERYCGVARDGSGLQKAFSRVNVFLETLASADLRTTTAKEAYNAATAAAEILKAAIARRVSVGAHYRTDEDKLHHAVLDM
jgi:L-aspartate oxidase